MQQHRPSPPRPGDGGAPVPAGAEAARILVRGLVLAGVFLVLFGVVVWGFLSDTTAALDQSTFLTLQRHAQPGLDFAARVVSLFGSQALAVVLAVAVVYAAWRRAWLHAAGMVVSTGGAQVLNDVLKLVYHRARPVPLTSAFWMQAYSFPSGHAMVSMAFYAFLAYLIWRAARGQLLRTAVVAAAILLVGAIGLARIYLGAHWVTDVVGGYLASLIWVDAVIVATRVVEMRRGAALSAGGDAAKPPGSERRRAA